MNHASSRLRSSDSASTILVVDDDHVFRGAVSSLLRSVGHEVQEFSNPLDMLAYPKASAAHCMILDVRLQGYSGLEVQTQLTALGMSLPIIFMTGHGDVPMSVKAMKAGAVDFFSKPFNHQDFLDSVAKAVSLYRESLEKREQMQSLQERFSRLTNRERQVMAGVVDGLLNKQIASNLNISEITVKVHRASTMRKMGVTTLADLVRISQLLTPQ